MTREEAVAVARTWIGTPYVLGGRIKRAGCDCATLLAEYLIECGFAGREELGVYSHDWFCHTDSERYMRGLLRHARRTMEGICRGTARAQPGSLILFRVIRSRVYNHGAIVTHWPMAVHADCESVTEIDLTRHPLTAFMEMAIFDPFGDPPDDPFDPAGDK